MKSNLTKLYYRSRISLPACGSSPAVKVGDWVLMDDGVASLMKAQGKLRGNGRVAPPKNANPARVHTG